ncbi:uncharacterized protein EDB91DRAFT_1243731 [Suillus paluster]|uniref:uncharacterized protein n=1 Tax=Suillus paluster TaxID=48578 RepID=UPI001B87F4F2|nr:uncharacterized protein EDB91DRAFT_1243731 [Suillus paluster]KAG1751470.1 hypothetical protein EDB91DRAFT_1243731 [Suillus paluster]
MFYEEDKAPLREEGIDRDIGYRTVIEMKLNQESTIPRIFKLTRFLVRSMTFLLHVRHVIISLDDAEMSRVAKTRSKASQSMAIPKHMVSITVTSHLLVSLTAFQVRKALMVLAAQEVNVIFAEDALIGAPKTLITRVDVEESLRNPRASRRRK